MTLMFDFTQFEVFGSPCTAEVLDKIRSTPVVNIRGQQIVLLQGTSRDPRFGIRPSHGEIDDAYRNTFKACDFCGSAISNSGKICSTFGRRYLPFSLEILQLIDRIQYRGIPGDMIGMYEVMVLK